MVSEKIQRLFGKPFTVDLFVPEEPKPSEYPSSPTPNYMRGEKAKLEAINKGFDLRAVVVRRNENSKANAFHWGIICALSDVLKDGNEKPCGVKWIANPNATLAVTDWHHPDELVLLHRGLTVMEVFDKGKAL